MLVCASRANELSPASARRGNQHAGRVRYPEEDFALLQYADSADRALEREEKVYPFLYPKKPRRRMISATCGGTISSQLSSPVAMRLSTSRENIGKYFGL